MSPQGHTISVEIELPVELIRRLLQMGSEGCSPWMRGWYVGKPDADVLAGPLEDSEEESFPLVVLAATTPGLTTVVTYDAPAAEEPQSRSLCWTDVCRGLDTVVLKYPRQMVRMIRGDVDDVDVDVLMQCIIFDQVVFP